VQGSSGAIEKASGATLDAVSYPVSKRPCWVEIRTQAFEENYRFLASLAAPHAEVLAVVKANAYGHSLALCAPAAMRGGARWLGVTSVEEGVETRAICPEARILAIGGPMPGQSPEVVAHKLTVLLWEPWQIEEMEAAARAAGFGPGTYPVHLEIDTGMSRQGAFPNEIEPLLKLFTPSSPLRLEGVMTHLYAADEGDGVVTQLQFERLETALRAVATAGLYPDWLNVGSSAALVSGLAESIGALAARFGMKALIRPGLALYGITPRFEATCEKEPESLAAARAALKPVLNWKSRILGVRTIPTGATVGYNGTFVASEPMRIGLVAAGYADGVDRHLGNHFRFLIRGQRAPLVGRVCMDHAMIDLTDIEDAAAGDEVVLLGVQGAEEITAQDHADATGTIPWEVFTRIGARVERLAVK